MNNQNSLEVIDRAGWRKEYPLEGGLIYIGSAPGNNIVLDPGRGGGVISRHIQLIPAPGGEGYRLINLDSQPLAVAENEGQALQPREVVDLVDGLRLSVGEFTLIFHTEMSPSQMHRAAKQKASGAIGLSVSLPDTQLSPAYALEGKITVTNLGQANAVQFKLELAGLEAEHYRLDPGPLLFPNAEADLLLRLKHPRQPKPAAGPHQITITATAPDAYPGERVSVKQAINILPYFQHQLRLVAAD